MRIAICEDEPAHTHQLSKIIDNWTKFAKTEAHVTTFANAESFIISWDEADFDMVILDIQMGQMTGLELAECIRKEDSEVIILFVTSHSQHALHGFKVNAMNYLVKPISDSDIIPYLDKAFEQYRAKTRAALIVPHNGALVKLTANMINCISMSSHDAIVKTKSGEYSVRKTAEELLDILPSYFIQCHRSHIVNMHEVECLFKNKLLLHDKTQLPVSRGKSQAVHDMFMRLGSGG